jgi:hypothetical protein
MDPSKNRIATCMCRALKVSTQGEPFRVSICHCLDCKVRSGSAFAYQARWKNEDIRIDGEYGTYVRLHEDGDRAEFNFCRQCGSNVFYRIESMPGITAVAVGAFADPRFYHPEYSVYETRKHAWVTLPKDGMEHFD